jgi:hypothetical protein
LNHRLAPAAVLLASLGLASSALAAADSPATGKWKGKNGDNEAASFRVAKDGSKFTASSLRVVANAQCEDPTDPSGPVSIEIVHDKLAGGTLGSKDGERRMAEIHVRKLSSTRTRTVRVSIVLTGDRAGKATVKVKDETTGKRPLLCRTTTKLKVKPVS